LWLKFLFAAIVRWKNSWITLFLPLFFSSYTSPRAARTNINEGFFSFLPKVRSRRWLSVTFLPLPRISSYVRFLSLISRIVNVCCVGRAELRAFHGTRHRKLWFFAKQKLFLPSLGFHSLRRASDFNDQHLIASWLLFLSLACLLAFLPTFFFYSFTSQITFS
jgi:hypothetical protein